MLIKKPIEIDRDASVKRTLAPLQPYFDDPDVYEIRINKFGQIVCDTVQGRRYIDAAEITKSYLVNLTNTLISYNGLSRTPISNVMLPDGSRGIVCWPPAVIEGTVLMAFRKHSTLTKTLEELAAEGRFEKTRSRKFQENLSLEPFEEELIKLDKAGNYANFFKQAVIHKRNIAVAGSTDSGKSFFTRSLLLYVPPHERVLLMEDVHEVVGFNQHEIGYMLYGSQEGRVSAKECLKACMRLSPDRIFMTELRDDAAWEYLSSANTGHKGSIFSTHADDAQSTPYRIASLVKASEVGRTLDYDVIMKTIHSTLDIIVFMENRNIAEVLYDPMYKKKTFSN